MTEPSLGFEHLLSVLNRLRIPYFIGGSMASSIHGVYRPTADIDVVAELGLGIVASLVSGLGPDFFADQAAIEQSLRMGESFNLIHLPSSYKFDIFPLSRDPYQQSQFERRTEVEFQSLHFPIATAEDTILSKLAWYKLGGEISDRQWDDIVGVAKVQEGQLDLAYMRKWSQYLKVEELLERALAAKG